MTDLYNKIIYGNTNINLILFQKNQIIRNLIKIHKHNHFIYNILKSKYFKLKRKYKKIKKN